MAMGSTAGVGSGARRRGALFLLVRLGGLLDHAAATIEAIRRDAMAQVRLPRLRIGGQRRRREPVVRAMHTAPGGRLATFLNRHSVLVRPKRALTSNSKNPQTTCVSTARRAPRRAAASQAPAHPP